MAPGCSTWNILVPLSARRERVPPASYAHRRVPFPLLAVDIAPSAERGFFTYLGGGLCGLRRSRFTLASRARQTYHWHENTERVVLLRTADPCSSSSMPQTFTWQVHYGGLSTIQARPLIGSETPPTRRWRT